MASALLKHGFCSALWSYRKETADISWIDDDTVTINGLTLVVPKEKLNMGIKILLLRRTSHHSVECVGNTLNPLIKNLIKQYSYSLT